MCCPRDKQSDAIVTLLLGDDAKIDEAIVLIFEDTRFRYGIGACLRQGFPGLASDDLGDVFVDALMDLCAMARRGDFRKDGDLWALLRLIARRRGTDLLRKKQRGKPRETGREPADAGLAGGAPDGRDVFDTGAGPVLCTGDPESIEDLAVEELARCHELREAVVAFLDGLAAGRQRDVLEVFVELGLDASLEELTAQVARHSSNPHAVTEDSVRRAKQEVLGKLRVFLGQQCPEWLTLYKQVLRGLLGRARKAGKQDAAERMQIRFEMTFGESLEG